MESIDRAVKDEKEVYHNLTFDFSGDSLCHGNPKNWNVKASTKDEHISCFEGQMWTKYPKLEKLGNMVYAHGKRNSKKY